MSSTTMRAGSPLEQQRIGDAEFRRIRELMYDHVGIVLLENKRALVEARVNKRLRALGVQGYAEYLDRLGGEGGAEELVQLTDAISTNVTHFFRENDHFDFAARAVRDWLAAGRTRLRFWSAACSSGEEPYSLAMTLAGIEGVDRADVRILATDISTRVLRTAAAGVYPEDRTAGIPAELQRRWFAPAGAGQVAVSPGLRERVLFRRLNLNRTPYPIKGVFELVFCRNVMIYFDAALRRRIVEEAHRLLQPDGYLIIGHAETLIGVDNRFRFVQPSVYRKVG